MIGRRCRSTCGPCCCTFPSPRLLLTASPFTSVRARYGDPGAAALEGGSTRARLTACSARGRRHRAGGTSGASCFACASSACRCREAADGAPALAQASRSRALLLDDEQLPENSGPAFDGRRRRQRRARCLAARWRDRLAERQARVL
jgi:hypothetical protein